MGGLVLGVGIRVFLYIVNIAFLVWSVDVVYLHCMPSRLFCKITYEDRIGVTLRVRADVCKANIDYVLMNINLLRVGQGLR